ncbi:hypothetical protein M8818_005218 [Zalaria obscura]|uniref:Uncharacterized protein n=1 Tax=Zalaria obscura TaxID=2024903 RepID=A0ACC3S9Z8_9PEZI
MESSMTLLNAQLQFLHTQLALIHIPLSIYPLLLQPILRLLTLPRPSDNDRGTLPRKPWEYSSAFANISVTTIECSLVCPRDLWHELFAPLVAKLEPSLRNQISISRDDFMIIQVGGEGIEAGQRVLDVTAPLALAGISIFFITSYYSDFILIPMRSRDAVIHALEDQGFAFDSMPNGHFSANMSNVSSPLKSPSKGSGSFSHTNSLAHHRATSSHSSGGSVEYPLPQSPGTPPPQTVAGWQTKTFQTLKRAGIEAQIDGSMELKLCAGYKGDLATQEKVECGIIKSLLHGPRFLSITLTETDSVSLTLERSLLAHFSRQGEGVLLTSEETLIPIMLDLSELPEESAGIICGVAGRLIDRMKMVTGDFNMSYLSTARAGNVILRDEEVELALTALNEGAEEMEKVQLQA